MKHNGVQLSLCKPNREIVGILQEAYDITHEVSLGDLSLLQFKVPFKLALSRNNKKNRNIAKLKEKHMILYQYQQTEEYFLIQKVVKSHTDNDEYMQIECSGLPIQLSYRTIANYKGVSKTASQLLSDGLKGTAWAVGSIHGEYDVSRRSVEFSGNLLQFIMDVAEAFEALVIFNTLNKTVNLHHPKHFGANRGFYTTYGKLLDSITYESDSTAQATRLLVRGKNGLTIAEATSTGTAFLEDYSYYYDDMSDELREAIVAWQQLKESRESEFSELLHELTDQRARLATASNQMSELKSELALLLDTLDVRNSRNEDVSSILAQKNAKDAQLAVKEGEINTLLLQIAGIYSGLQQLNQVLSPETNLSREQLLELDEFIYEAEYANEYVSDSMQLKELALQYFKEIREPKLTASIEIVNLFKVLGMEENSDREKVRLGDYINIEYELSDIEITAQIIGIQFQHESGTIQLTISNVAKSGTYEARQAKQIYASMGHSNAFAANKFAYDNNIARTDEVSQILQSTWSAIDREIEGGLNNSISMSRRGLLITDAQEPQKMLILQNGVLGLSKNGGLNWQTAITPDGVIAERLLGQLIAGQNLIITNQSGSFTVDDRGMTATDMVLEVTRENRSGRILISPHEGFRLQKNTGTTASPVWMDQIVLDTNGDVLFKGKVAIGTGNSIFKADESGIYLGSSSFSNAPFRVDPTGQMTASKVNVTGGTMAIGGNFNVDSAGNATMRNANINGNINMTGGSISWGSINSDPVATGAQNAANTAINAANNAHASANGALSTAIALANGTYTGNSNTFIDGRKVQSAEIIGGKIIGGTIESGSKINVQTIAYIGDSLYVGNSPSQNTKAIYLMSNSTSHMGAIKYNPESRVIELSAQNGVQSLNTFFADSVIVKSSLYLGSENVATERWVQKNVIARFG